MHKFVVVTDRDSAAGFRLAGVDAFEATGPDDAKGIITSLINKDDMGIVAVNEDFLTLLDEKLREKLEKLHRPIIVPIPSRSKGADRRSYIERLLRKAIGYNVVMRR
jgi:V/A-type H+-transporting ATPase subunit F